MDVEAPAKKTIPYKIFRGAKVPSNSNERHLVDAVSYEAKPGDVFINTYPKCGTTWIQHIVYLIKTGGRPASDVSDILAKIPFPEQDGFPANKEYFAVKYHLPFRLTPYSRDAKYIVVARNPMDTCVSYYHFLRSLPNYDISSFDDFFEAFIKGELPYGDFFDHFASWYSKKNEPNVLFLTYESMKSHHEGTVRKIATFLGTPAILHDNKLLHDIVLYSSTDYMRSLIDGGDIMNSYLRVHNDETNCNIVTTGAMKAAVKDKPKMVRKGTVGDWKNYFSRSQEKRMKLKLAERLRQHDILKLWAEAL